MTTSRGRIELTGTIDTPTPCYTLTPDLSSTDQQLTLRVVARANESGVCVLVLGRFSYSGAITLPAGTYSLSVIHTYPNTGWPTTEVLKQTVSVD